MEVSTPVSLTRNGNEMELAVTADVDCGDIHNVKAKCICCGSNLWYGLTRVEQIAVETKIEDAVRAEIEDAAEGMAQQ